MDPEDAEELAAELHGKAMGVLDLLQIATGAGLTAYVVWAGILMPGFRSVPLKLQVLEAYKRGFRPAVGYELNPWLLRLSRYRAWKAGCSRKVFYCREDLWKVNLSDCKNVTVFLAPSVLLLLERKLLVELPEEARVVAGRFPLPSWTPTSMAGEGLNRAWAYDMKTVRQAQLDKPEGSPV
ncbi:adenine nucleotide translocase lysine N-methyltransferase isoform X2 [Rhineura floridana]|uniref:adenine nucleotide translocase lysine N-methyltransferase isoform X2 n=1 Tax=Rhineura floridana TaxID=261503 RepID=UPI002AC7ED57|nr:adenine nucleotide translocase lysine N-methyltransferase isoform X2 [Rhineura floridana]